MAKRLLDHRALHELDALERTSPFVRQRDLVRRQETVRRYGEDKGVSGESAFSVLERSLIVRTSQPEAVQLWTADGKKQLEVGTEDAADGGEPYLYLGEDIDADGYRIKLHGRLGHLHAPAGFLQTTTHHGGKTETEVYARGDGSGLAGADAAAWTADSPANGGTTTGRWLLYTTAATTGNARGPNGPLDYVSAWEVDARWIVQMGSDITNQRVWAILGNGDPSGSSTPALEFAGWRYNTPDSTWVAYTGDGASRTSTDSGIAVTANQKYALRVRLFSTQAQMILGLPEVVFGGNDGTFTVIHTTNLPVNTTLLRPYLRITTLENVAKSIRFGRFKCTSW